MNFSTGGKYGLFWEKKLIERWYLLITKKFLFLKFSRTGNTVFFWNKKMMDRWYLMVTEKFLFWATEKFLFWTFRWWEIRSFFSQKVDVRITLAWSFRAFNDIPGHGKYGFSCGGTLLPSLLGKLLTGKRKMRAGKGIIRAGEQAIRAGQKF